VQAATKAAAGQLRFAERFLELLIDLLSQLPTRRFLKAVLQVRACMCLRC
jgi:hypothetical protein